MAQGQSGAVADAPDTLPADFFDKQQGSAPDTLPADFFDKQQAQPQAAPGTATGISAPAKPQPPKLGEVGKTSNPFSGYLNEAENLTEEGKKAHPIENFVGGVARAFESPLNPVNIIGKMSPIFMGSGAPEEVAGMDAAPIEAPKGIEAPKRITDPGHMLPAGPSKPALVTPPPADASFVRGIPAEYGTPVPKAEPTPAAGPAPKLEDFLNKVYNVEPLKPNVSLRDQLPVAAPTQDQSIVSTAKTGTLQERYPDKGLRQMVHANGEKIVDAVGGDTETMKAIHNLTKADLQTALQNAGEDLGQKVISSSKFLGSEGAISRQEAFDRLLGKGLTPQQIVKLAKGAK